MHEKQLFISAVLDWYNNTREKELYFHLLKNIKIVRKVTGVHFFNNYFRQGPETQLTIFKNNNKIITKKSIFSQRLTPSILETVHFLTHVNI